MSDLKVIKGRYELRQILGRGGMGIVYRAFDTHVGREVAVKTLRDISNETILELFHREMNILAGLVHPNIVEIHDIGEIREGSETKPFFVMPLLPGVTLGELIGKSSHNLTVERSVDIMCQACRGLQAAHEKGLIHRDIKPSNFLILPDDSVKIIDFGVAHVLDDNRTTRPKGTPYYMSPEQIRSEQPKPQTDIFSLAVVCYETLTGRRPFSGSSESEISDAILNSVPALISELNPNVNTLLSRVVHKAMAKQVWHRFSSARELGDALQKGIRNEPIPTFETADIVPRVERARKAFERGEYEFAAEILDELEAEGHSTSSITRLRRKLNETLLAKTTRTLLEGARRCLEEQEYTLALRKVQEVLQLKPDDANALVLKKRVEEERREKKIDEWFQLAEKHLANNSFGHARHAVENVLKVKPSDTKARRLKEEVDRREREYKELRQEKANLHEQAVKSWESGEITAALDNLERLMNLDKKAPDTDPERAAGYRDFYQQVRSERDRIEEALQEARKRMEDGDFKKALKLCDEFLEKLPEHTLFQALKLDIQDRERQSLSSYIAEIDERVAKQTDLEKRVRILEEALERYPDEPHFSRALRDVRHRRDLVTSIVSKAQLYEERGRFREAIDQLQTVRSIHGDHPGLEIELERLNRRRKEQAAQEAKARWIEKVDALTAKRNHVGAAGLCRQALEEFPDDPELTALLELTERKKEESEKVRPLIDEGGQLREQGRFDEGAKVLRQALELDKENVEARELFVQTLLQQARSVIDKDYESAGRLVQETLQWEPNNALAQSLQSEVAAREREKEVSRCAAEARRMQAAGKANKAVELIDQVLSNYPGETKLLRLRDTVAADTGEQHDQRAHLRALNKLESLEEQAGALVDEAEARRLEGRVRRMEQRWSADTTIQERVRQVREKIGKQRAVLTPDEVSAPASEPAPKTKLAPGAPTPTGPPKAAGSAETDTRVAPVELQKAPASPATGVARQEAQKKTAAKMGPGGVKRLGEARQGISAAFSKLSPQIAAALQPLVDLYRRQPRLLLGGLAFVAVLSAGLAWLLLTEPAPPPPQVPVAVTVSLSTAPAGATITVAGESCVSPCEFSLEEGSYQVQAALAGHYPVTRVLDTASPWTDELRLEQMPTLFRITTDLESGEVTVDDQLAGALTDGQFELELEPGEHTVKVAGGNSEASFVVQSAIGKSPQLLETIQSRNLACALVMRFGDIGQVHTNVVKSQLTVDGQLAGELGPEPLELASLNEGSHELLFSEGDLSGTMILEVGPEPTVTVLLSTDRDAGVLIVMARDSDGNPLEGANIVISGGAYSSPRQIATRSGGKRAPYVPPGEYTVHVESEGYKVSATQRVEIQKGLYKRLEFVLQPEVEFTQIELTGLPAGAEVLIDGRAVGRIGRNGRFGRRLQAGSHRIALAGLGGIFEGVPVERDFPAGDTPITLTAEDLLQVVKGELVVSITPADVKAEITLKSEQGSASNISPGEHYGPPGYYTLSASAPGFQDTQVARRVQLGQSVAFELTLLPEGSGPETIRLSLDDLTARTTGWQQEEQGWFVREGGGFALLPMPPRGGIWTFTANPRRGPLGWVLNYTDENNYLLFELDGSSLYRTEKVQGQSERTRVVRNIPRSGIYTVKITATSGRIDHQILLGNERKPHEGSIPTSGVEGDFTNARFGFHVPGKNLLAVSHSEFAGH